jgi:DNA-binding HxlR family transcriptional regulator
MRRTSLGDAICPIARALDEIGDWWTMLIVRDAFQGKRRFSEFQASLGLAKNILSARLKTLVGNGILQKQPAPDGSAHGEYHLTEKGRRLRLVLIAVRQWGEDNLFADGEPMMLALDSQHRPIARLQLLNEEGKRLEPGEIVVSRGRKGNPRPLAPKTRPARVK